MKKEFKFYGLAWLISLILFNVIVFATPNEIAGLSKFTPLFWVGYTIITIAFISQLGCAHVVFKEDNLSKFFLNLPLVTVSYSALIAMLVVGGVCMAIPIIPTWIGIIVCILIMGYYAIALIQAKAASDIVGGVDNKIKEKTFFIKSSLLDVEMLLHKTEDVSLKKRLTILEDVLKYSDPVSSPSLQSIEQKIEDKIAELNILIENSSTEDAVALAEEIKTLLEQRNKKCMLLK